MGKHFGRISEKARAARTKILTNAEFLLDHAGSIHYDQARPIDFNFRALPWTADCSGSTIAIFKDAGAPDPSGNGFSGSGNTDSILAHLPRVERRNARKGDLVLFHNGTDGKHVAVLLESPRWHSDPMLESHGGEYGPLHIALSSEIRYHAGEEVTFLKGVPDWYK